MAGGNFDDTILLATECGGRKVDPIRDDGGLVASINDIGSIPASTVTAWFEGLKTVAILFGTAFTAIGTIVGGLIHFNTRITQANTKKTELNTQITEANTAAAVAIAPVVASNTAEMDKATREFLTNVKSWNAMIVASRAEMKSEMDKLKIGVAKVNLSMNDKLSGIPKVQDALKELEDRVNEHEGSFQAIKNLTDELKKRKGS